MSTVTSSDNPEAIDEAWKSKVGKVCLSAMIVIALLVLAYVVFRAASVSLTLDETGTYLNYVRGGLGKATQVCNSGNHVLNSVLAVFSTNLLGESELSLRLPNLLSCCMYLLFSVLTVRKLFSPFFALCAFVLLCANPYLLEFFGLCRGYGVALGCQMTAIFFLVQMGGCGFSKHHYGYCALIVLAFGVLANFAWLVPFCGLCAALVVGFIWSNRKRIVFSRSILLSQWRCLIRWRTLVVCLCLLCIVVAWCATAGWSTLRHHLAVPVTVSIECETSSIEEISSVRRLSPRGNVYDLEHMGNGEWVVEPVRYTSGIEIVLPNNAVDTLVNVKLRVGAEEHEYTHRDFLKRWTPMPSQEKGTSRFRSPASLKEHAIPFMGWDGIINWKGNGVLLRSSARGAVIGGIVSFLLIIAASWALFLIVATKILDWKQIACVSIIPVMLGSLIAYPIFCFIRWDAFFYGGNDSLISDTIRSLTTAFGYRQWSGNGLYVILSWACVACVCLLPVLMLSVRVRSGVRNRINGTSLILVMLFSCVIVIELQHHLMGSVYPINRVALYLVPLFAVVLVSLFQRIADLDGLCSSVSKALLVGITILAATHTVTCANIERTYHWQSAVDAKSVLSDIAGVKGQLRRGRLNDKLRLGCQWRLSGPIKAYATMWDWDWLITEWLPVNEKDRDNSKYDFIYVIDEAFLPEREEAQLLHYYEKSGSQLFRSTPPAPVTTSSTLLRTTSTETTQ